MFVLHFFLLQCVKKEFSNFVYSKNQTACTFFLQNIVLLIYKYCVIDIVLDVLENSHGNVYSEVFSKVVACQHGFVNSSRLRFTPDFQNTEGVSRGDLQE